MKKGFTLTEMLVVIAILAIMVLISIPVISSITTKAGRTADTATCRSIELSISNWMDTDYNDDSFLRGRLYNSSTGAVYGKIYGLSEQMYSYYYAGTGQLPGTELKDSIQIRHAAITAIKATSDTKIIIDGTQQYIEHPKSGSQYGFKYYYKIGRVSAEIVGSGSSIFGDDEVYQYYVWLDRPGGSISSSTVPKHYKDSVDFDVPEDTLYAFYFNYGSHNVQNIRVVIEQGEQSYTFTAATSTPAMFRPGVYKIRVYDSGKLYFTYFAYSLNAGAEAIRAY